MGKKLASTNDVKSLFNGKYPYISKLLTQLTKPSLIKILSINQPIF